MTFFLIVDRYYSMHYQDVSLLKIVEYSNFPQILPVWQFQSAYCILAFILYDQVHICDMPKLNHWIFHSQSEQILSHQLLMSKIHPCHENHDKSRESQNQVKPKITFLSFFLVMFIFDILQNFCQQTIMMLTSNGEKFKTTTVVQQHNHHYTTTTTKDVTSDHQTCRAFTLVSRLVFSYYSFTASHTLSHSFVVMIDFISKSLFFIFTRLSLGIQNIQGSRKRGTVSPMSCLLLSAIKH